MNYRDRRASQSDDDLASFVSEAAIGGTSLDSEQPRHPLWDFPAEASPSVAAANIPPIRKLSQYASYASLAAAILIAAIAGAWWGELIPGNRPVAVAESPQPVAIAPVMNPRPDAPGQPPTQVIASVELQPSTWLPVAGIVPNVAPEDAARTESPPPKPIALSGGAAELRRPLERAASTARGTSGGAPTAPPVLAPRPSPEPASLAPTAAVANPAVRSPVPEPPLALDASPATLPPVRMPGAAVLPEPEALPSVVARTEQSEIQRTLGQYRSAYSLLDAEAARAVWPSVDVRALARAFDSLTSQQLAFETCQFEIVGEAATAQCRGSATYTPKVGSRGPKLEPRQWTFHLRKVDEGWKIQSAQTRR
jgi:hypothetical protein